MASSEKPINKIFTFRTTIYSIGSKLVSRYSFTLLHHILPFSFERTFNPIALNRTEVPFLVGLVPASHTLHFMDEMAFDKVVCSPMSYVKSYANYTGNYLLAPVLRHLFIKTLERASKVIVVSENAKVYYSRYVPNHKLVILPYGVNINLFRPNKGLAEAILDFD